MNETLRQVLDNKDQIVQGLQLQLQKQRKQLETNRSLRLSNEKDLSLKAKDIDKLKQRLEHINALVLQKRKDPNKLQLIQHLKNQTRDKQKLYETAYAKLTQTQQDLSSLNSQSLILENTKSSFLMILDKNGQDQEDVDYLEEKIQLSEDQIMSLKEQNDKLQKMMIKRQHGGAGGNGMNGVNGGSETQQKSMMVVKVNEEERETQRVIREIEKGTRKIEELQDKGQRVWAINNTLRDKLLYTLGRQKGNSTGNLCFFFRYHLQSYKMQEILQAITILLSQNQDYRTSLLESLAKFQNSKQLISVTDFDLSQLAQTTYESESWLIVMCSQITDLSLQLAKYQRLVESFSDKLKAKCAKEVFERLKITDQENVECIVRIERVEETLSKFDKEVERLLKIGRLQGRKEEFMAIKKVLMVIKEDSNELNANFFVIKLVIEKSRLNTRNVEMLNITKIEKILIQIKGYEHSLHYDQIKLAELEKRVKDLQVLFNDVIQQISQETHTQLVNQLNHKTKMAQELQKKDNDLYNLIEGRKSDLFNIRSQISDDDHELQNIFETNQFNLEDAGGDEEQAQEQQRQILSRTDNLFKQFQNIKTLDLNSFDKANELLEQLDEMDSFIQGAEQKIEEGFQKANNLEENLREMEKRLRNQRINDCEQYLRLTFELLDKLRKLIERMTTQISVIEKDQNHLLNNDQFPDQEKRKEIQSFALELDNKNQQLASLTETKESLKLQIDVLEKDFQQKLREKGSSNSIQTQSPNDESSVGQNDGREYVKLRREAEKVREEISRQISLADGEISDEVSICKEVNSKMVQKYKAKKDKFTQCKDLRGQKLDEFKEWQDKLGSLRDREQTLEASLAGLGISQGENKDALIKFINGIEKIKTQATGIEKQIQLFSRRIKEEAVDLDVIDSKVVKTAKLEEIYKLLQEVKITCDPYEDFLEKLDLMLRQLEKDVEAFMIKTRSSQLFECESKLKKVEQLLERLVHKIQDVNKDLGNFNQEVNQCDQQIETKDQLLQSLDELGNQMDESEMTKDSLQKQLELIMTRIALLDKKNLSVADCTQIINDASNMEEVCISEYKQVTDVQDRLRALMLQFRDSSKNELERQRLISLAKLKLKDNQALFKQMKTLLTGNQEKLVDFDTIYHAMQGSDDYHSKKPLIEKKLRRMAQIRSECNKFQEDKDHLNMQKLTSVNEDDLDKIQDIDELTRLIEDNDKVHSILKTDVKELGEMHKDFEKRRVKIADAEIRSIASKRKEELEKVRTALLSQMTKLTTFEEQLRERELENAQSPSSQFSPEKQSQLQRTLEGLKQQFQEFKDQFERVEDEIRNVNEDLSQRELERDEPLPKLARDIERLKKTTFEVKDLKLELEKIQIELQAKSNMLSSLDTEKKLKSLLKDLLSSASSNEKVQQILNRVLTLSNTYDGYTSGNEDEEFFTVMGSESKDLLSDFNLLQNKTFKDLNSDLEGLHMKVEQLKQEGGGNLKVEDVEDVNEHLGRLEVKVSKAKRQREEIEAQAYSNLERMAQHDQEQKLSRRREEVEELEKIIHDINNDNQSIREKISNEIEACQGNAKMDAYVNKLANIMENTQRIEEKASDIHKHKIDLEFDVDQALTDLETNKKDTNQRLESLDTNLSLKKRIQDSLKQISSLHALVKQVFTQTNEVFAKKPVETAYKFVAGDDVDKMLAEILNRLGINVPIKRLGGGYYMFGTKKIFCKIINGKLVVRVGGGYMGIEEFILQYGQSEIDKMNNQANIEAQLKEAASSGKTGSTIKLPLKTTHTSKGLDSPKTGRSNDDSFSVGGGHGGAATTTNKVKSSFSQISDNQKATGGGASTSTFKKSGGGPASKK